MKFTWKAIGDSVKVVVVLTVTVLLYVSSPRLIAWLSGVGTTQGVFDSTAPWSGNPAGDVTIVAFHDFNCGYCRQVAPELDLAIREDGRSKVVYKDWPILGPSSVVAARIALAAAHQGRYVDAHRSLMAIRGGNLTEERLFKVLAETGLDIERLRVDLTLHNDEISRQLARNTVEAASLGLNGTPVYFIGRFRAGVLNKEGFKRAISMARERAGS